ncbi:MAG TPA: alanine--tRNA ligase [Gammaproteobacteria bacterium]|nr:alanine--tRNA ligase [Gammaproteobacteria bacterium]
MTSNDIRKSFLEFFQSKGHTVVPSSPLVPANDPTLLFTNAGMVQFKDVFLGRDKRDYKRAASSQRCVRAGGKHNDLENVGYTARHHTFFEMLGNFSFGDYFKKDAILYSWELLTQVWKLPPEKLWVTVYHTDDEAYGHWLNDVGVPAARIVRIGDKPGGQKYQSDNFWQMADTGPCGPCSEIFYDHGDKVAGGPPGSADADGDRYIEIWNLVFMQFDRSADGVLTPLPKPCVDTGMGLERVTAVLQHVHSNYEIDLFQKLITAAADVTGAKDKTSPSLRVIADHIRACAFLITDGVLPSNEGRGYVLRRIIRRAIRHGYKLGQEKPFFHKLVKALDAEMGGAYPELHKAASHVEKVLLQEEERFAETLDQGMRLLESAIKDLKGKTLAGETVFKLYDTYGFPADLTNDIARERGLAIDEAGFEREMESQRDRARSASKFGAEYGQDVVIGGETAFKGYEHLKHPGKVVALFRGKDAVQSLKAGEQGMVVLDQTPFYAESGGQVGDQGALTSKSGEFKVADTQKRGGGAFAHMGSVTKGEIKLGDTLDAQVDEGLRAATVLNHSATHLLHAALRKVLGTHVTQKGSLVAPDRLRFDFSHYQAVTPEELAKIEDLVNTEVRRNEAADVRESSYDEAIKAGAMALFGEKYGNVVRVMKFGDFSTELCGGTHVRRTGDIGLFKILSEGGVAAGVRRIEAVTGAGALAYVNNLQGIVRGLEETLRTDDVLAKTQALQERVKQLEKQLAQASGKLAANRGDELLSQAKNIGEVSLLVSAVDGVDAAGLRDLQDQLKNKLKSGIVVLASADSATNKVAVIVGVTADLTGKVKAGELVNMVAQQVGGKGGGRPDMAQAGGTDPSKLDAALKSVPDWVRAKIA